MIGAIEDRIRAVRDAMTPGQRWTAALALAFATVVMGFGLPHGGIVRVTAAQSVVAVPGLTPTPSPVDAFQTPTMVSPILSYAPYVAFEPTPPVQDNSSASNPSPQPAPQAGVVALVHPADSTTPSGRADADIARTFLPDARTVVLDASATCASLVGNAGLFVATADIPAPLRSCLTASGAVVLAHDHAGTDADAFSTRRSVTASVRTIGRPAGRVGLAAAERFRDSVQPLASSLGAVAVTLIPEGSATSEIREGARRFAEKGVTTVVFALPSSQQAQWVADQSIFSPGVRWLVADAFDAGRVESFPPTFDGARLVTTARGPWSTRANGETAEQRRCRGVWESSARITLDSEAESVYAWCQIAALRNASGGGTDAAALRAVRYESPLTSPLGPTGDTWGPLTDAELEWRSGCGCWQVVRNFGPGR